GEGWAFRWIYDSCPLPKGEGGERSEPGEGAHLVSQTQRLIGYVDDSYKQKPAGGRSCRCH
ncbi:MAG: hypothetical protein ACRD18_15350, partial [Terriglobia bacterium]